jgi:hypothetical protein
MSLKKPYPLRTFRLQENPPAQQKALQSLNFFLFSVFPLWRDWVVLGALNRTEIRIKNTVLKVLLPNFFTYTLSIPVNSEIFFIFYLVLGERDENAEETDPLSCCYCRKPNPSKRCSKRHPKCIKKLYCNETCETLSHKKKEASFSKATALLLNVFW